MARRLVLTSVFAAGCARAGAVGSEEGSPSSQHPRQFAWTYDSGIALAERARQNPQPIDTPNPTRERLAATSDGPDAVEGAVRFCVGPTGSVTSADTETSTGDATLDEALRATVRAWTFKPAEFGGLRVEACSTATFVLSFR